jgi:hypothetical protein
MSSFQNLPTAIISNGLIELEVFSTAGPRIVLLSAFGKPNLFADLPVSLSTQYGEFYFRGGHRLWHSPEAIPRSYIPDNDGCRLEKTAGGVTLHGPCETGSGIAKTVQIQLMANCAGAVITHTLRNDGLWPVELAPWAISMFRLGGTVILPQPIGNADPDGLLNNRILALWPYAQMKDPRLEWRDDAILIRAFPQPGPFKLGYFNPHGWLAYWIDELLFQKRFDPLPGQKFPDGGCNTESYCNGQFVELESLGPLVTLQPGAEVCHTETWEIFPSLDVPFLSPEIRGVLVKS